MDAVSKLDFTQQARVPYAGLASDYLPHNMSGRPPVRDLKGGARFRWRLYDLPGLVKMERSLQGEKYTTT